MDDGTKSTEVCTVETAVVSRYPNLRPWRPGESGNKSKTPRGRSLVNRIREATNDGADMVMIQVSLMNGTIPACFDQDGQAVAPALSGEASDAVRQRAVEWLSDHYFGKADANQNVVEAVRAMVAEMVAAIDDEPVPEEIALRLKERWREIIGRY